jgi:hypothetical protein
MTGTCDKCKHFSDTLVRMSENEQFCRQGMLEFAPAYEPVENEVLDATEIE